MKFDINFYFHYHIRSLLDRDSQFGENGIKSVMHKYMHVCVWTHRVISAYSCKERNKHSWKNKEHEVHMKILTIVLETSK